MWLSDFVNHLYDYRLNWTPLSLITINNKGNTTEWSPTWSVIISVVHKIRQSQRGSLINHECDFILIGWHKVLLPINQYYDKFEKENRPCLIFFIKKNLQLTLWNAWQQCMLMMHTVHLDKHDISTVILHCPITSMTCSLSS